VPIQISVEEATIATVGVTGVFTVIVTTFDAALAGVAQGAVDVIMQRIISPSTKVVLIYVELFVPTLTPFNFH